MSDEKVMTQADIDALVSRVPPKPAAPKPAAPIAAAPKPAAPAAAAPKPAESAAAAPKPVAPLASTPKSAEPEKTAISVGAPRDGTAKYEKYTSNEVSNLQSTVADLARQVAKMTNVMQRLEKAEDKVAQIYSLLRLDPDETVSLGGRLDAIYGRVDELAKHYSDYQNEFECNHCKSKQNMALHVKCTSCGEEAWMGWWPEGHKKSSPSIVSVLLRLWSFFAFFEFLLDLSSFFLSRIAEQMQVVVHVYLGYFNRDNPIRIDPLSSPCICKPFA